MDCRSNRSVGRQKIQDLAGETEVSETEPKAETYSDEGVIKLNKTTFIFLRPFYKFINQWGLYKGQQPWNKRVTLFSIQYKRRLNTNRAVNSLHSLYPVGARMPSFQF